MRVECRETTNDQFEPSGAAAIVGCRSSYVAHRTSLPRADRLRDSLLSDAEMRTGRWMTEMAVSLQEHREPTLPESRNIRVCMVSVLFYPHYSGAANQAMALSKALVARGISVMFVARQFRDEPESEHYNGLWIHRVRSRGQGHLGMIRFWLGLFRVLYQLKNEYDVIHLHGLGPLQMLVGIYGKILRRKTVVKITMAAVDLDFESRGRLVGRLERWAFPYFNKFIALSSEISKELSALKIPDRRVAFLPNGVNAKRFHPVTAEEKEELRTQLKLSSGRIVTFVGQISHRKGTDVLIRAWKGVVSDYSEVHLVLIGPTADRDMHHPDHTFIKTIRALIEEYQLQRHIVMLGERQDVERYLQASDIFVLPSKIEGMPNVLLEAMACGLPCVTTRVSGTQDIIDDGANGILVEYGDSETLRMSLVRLLRDSERCRRIGVKARRTIDDRFSLERIADLYAMNYAELLGLSL